MICIQCGAQGAQIGARHCGHCGALLPDLPQAMVTSGNVVGDGSERAISAYYTHLALDWLRQRRLRLVFYAAALALVVGGSIAAIVAIIAIVTFVASFVAVIAPFIIVLLVLHALYAAHSTSRRRLRRGARIRLWL